MKVTEKDVKYIAALSRLEISDEEMPKFTEQFNQILNYADILDLPLYNVLREDVPQEGVAHEDALKNAPAVHNDGFKVPRVIE